MLAGRGSVPNNNGLSLAAIVAAIAQSDAHRECVVRQRSALASVTSSQPVIVVRQRSALASVTSSQPVIVVSQRGALALVPSSLPVVVVSQRSAAVCERAT